MEQRILHNNAAARDPYHHAQASPKKKRRRSDSQLALLRRGEHRDERARKQESLTDGEGHKRDDRKRRRDIAVQEAETQRAADVASDA
ncbi:hypothetical protein VFPFJ_01764 [Purpureocillium lilacinum]|uniref:Uncharacterized protein n=1 Tax=Purpureocillium lilacinum TaxID=33203 RepID=A0A179HTC4_PURLI|nr:hypothetical protein VFPFJ_01764 [Purpureocillium lilacinum]OAQ92603.1 hypothetical protein VFPFJ_01764 [Purpureocillium lilacinum]